MKNEELTKKEAVIELRISYDEAVRSFKIHHLTVYITLLTFINLRYTPKIIWFIYPITGEGIGLLAHYIYGVEYFEKYMSQKEKHI